MKRGNWTDGECYYVDVVDGPKVNLLAGPFRTHEEALKMVDPARDLALNYGDPKAWFYAYGTSKWANGYREGIFNKQLNI